MHFLFLMLPFHTHIFSPYIHSLCPAFPFNVTFLKSLCLYIPTRDSIHNLFLSLSISISHFFCLIISFSFYASSFASTSFILLFSSCTFPPSSIHFFLRSCFPILLTSPLPFLFVPTIFPCLSCSSYPPPCLSLPPGRPSTSPPFSAPSQYLPTSPRRLVLGQIRLSIR